MLLYPSVTRKALQTFDCIELFGETYLRADPAIHCEGDDWWFMAVLAAVGGFVTCILAPLALVQQTSRKHASSERVQRSRVALLTNTYQDKFHYWEAVRCLPSIQFHYPYHPYTVPLRTLAPNPSPHP